MKKDRTNWVHKMAGRVWIDRKEVKVLEQKWEKWKLKILN